MYNCIKQDSIIVTLKDFITSTFKSFVPWGFSTNYFLLGQN